jgi:hypothetical protein
VRLAPAALGASLALAACATKAPPPPAPAPTPPAAAAQAPDELANVPPEIAAHVREAERIGRLLYELDDASAVATDVLLEHMKSPADAGIKGWLPLRSVDDPAIPPGVHVVLFMTAEAAPHIAATVTLAPGAKPVFERHDPPREPSDAAARRFRARTTALASVRRTGQQINPVVLAGEPDVDGFVVYLLAGTTKPDELVLGLHHRAVVTPDGASLVSMTPLSRSAIVVSNRGLPPGAVPVAAVVSHVVTDWPLETHVFASLQHDNREIDVVTKRGRWRVVGDRVTFEGPLAPPPAPKPQ